MKTLLSPRRSARGSTYMTVVVTMIFFGVMLAAYLKLVSTQNVLAGHSQTWNRSVAVMEAGIEEAMAHLNKNGSPDSGGTFNLANMSLDGWANDGSPTGPWSKQGTLEGDIYYVVIGSWDGTVSKFPPISATGFVRQLPAYALRSSSGPFLAALALPNLEAGSFTRRAVSCGLTNNPTFSRGLVAKHGIDLAGNNVSSDSYDSANPAFSTNGRWDPTKHRDHGDIASNDTITNSVSVANANIWGTIATGPGGTVAIGPNGSVGNAAWQTAGNKGIQPGASSSDMNVEFPDTLMPAVAWSALPAGATVDGVKYDYVFNASGDYQMPVGAGNMSGKILISAPNVRIRVDSGWRFSGQDVLNITSNASVKIYLNCASADLTGQGVVNQSGLPAQCYIFGTEKLTSIDIGGNAATAAVVYAPYANANLHGGGSGDEDFSGAMIANTFKFVGHFHLHYDEALGRTGLWRGFTITSWNEK